MASDKVEKKRKRDSDRHERPSKKPALEPQNLPPLAASIVQDDSELAPVLGMFSFVFSFHVFIFLRGFEDNNMVSI
jgi:hypothetical protein